MRPRLRIPLAAALLALWSNAAAQTARISEETRVKVLGGNVTRLYGLTE